MEGLLILRRWKKSRRKELLCWMRGSKKCWNVEYPRRWGSKVQSQAYGTSMEARPWLVMGLRHRRICFPRRFMVFYNQPYYLDYRQPLQGHRGVSPQIPSGCFFFHTYHLLTFPPVHSSVPPLPSTHQLA